MTVALSTFLALSAFLFLIGVQPDAGGVAAGILLGAVTWLLSYVLFSTVQLKTEARWPVPSWVVGAVPAVAIFAIWFFALAPYLAKQESLRIEQQLSELNRLYPAESGPQARDPSGIPSEPYACRREHYNAATCAEQRRGNEALGRMVLDGMK